MGEVEEREADGWRGVWKRKGRDLAIRLGGRGSIGLHPLVGGLLDADQVVVRKAVGTGMVVALDSLPAILRHHVQ